MKKRYSKQIDPTRLQTGAFDDLHVYQQKMSSRGRLSSRRSSTIISKCYICGSIKRTEIARIFGSQYVRCSKCSHIYLTKRLSDRQLESFYNSDEGYAKTYTDKRQIKYRQKQVASPKVDFAFANMHFSSRKPKHWLDVGCAIGDIVNLVDQKKGWSATGIDISGSSIRAGQQIFKADLKQTTFHEFVEQPKQDAYDVVSFFGYLGLITNPMDELKQAHKILNEGGYVVIGEENADSVSTLVQQSFPDTTSRHLIPPNAIHMFTPRSIETVLSKAGFQIEAIWYFGLDFVELLKHLQLRDRKISKTPIYKFLLSHTNEFQQVCDSFEKSDYMVVVAKRL